MDVTVRFVPNDGTLDSAVVSEVELHFADGRLAGLKLVGFAVRRAPDGDLYVTLPARAFGQRSERRYFDFVRSQDGQHAKTGALKRWILDEYLKSVDERTAVARQPGHGPTQRTVAGVTYDSGVERKR